MMQSLVYSVVRTNKATYQLIKDQEDRKSSLSCASTICTSPREPSTPSILRSAQPFSPAKSVSKVHAWGDQIRMEDSTLECLKAIYPDNVTVSTLHSQALEVIELADDEECKQDIVRARGHGHGHGHGQLLNELGIAPPEVLVSDLQEAVGHLKVVFEANICLS